MLALVTLIPRACASALRRSRCLRHVTRRRAMPTTPTARSGAGGAAPSATARRQKCSLPFDAECSSCCRCAGVRACSGTATREPTSRSRTGPRGHRRWQHRCAASAKFEVRRLIPHAAVVDHSFLVHLVHRYCQRTLCGAFLAFWGFCKSYGRLGRLSFRGRPQGPDQSIY